MPLEIEHDMFIDNSPTFNDSPAGTSAVLVRLDGLNWQDDRYEIGQYVQLGGEVGTRQVFGFGDADDDLENDLVPSEAFNTWGTGSVMFLGQLETEAPVMLPDGASKITVHVANPLKESFTGTVDIATSSLTRTDGISWASEGFEIGQHVFISGLAGPFTISGFADATASGDIMELNELWPIIKSKPKKTVA